MSYMKKIEKIMEYLLTICYAGIPISLIVGLIVGNGNIFNYYFVIFGFVFAFYAITLEVIGKKVENIE